MTGHDDIGGHGLTLSQDEQAASGLECAPQPIDITPEAQTPCTVRLGAEPDGEVLFRGDIYDALEINRAVAGQSVVWRDSDGLAMTEPKQSVMWMAWLGDW